MRKASGVEAAEITVAGQVGINLTGEAGDNLERCLAELVRYYRHSAVGRRCSGLIHNMNSPLQVISFQLELLEQKAEEAAAVVGSLPASVAGRLEALIDYRDQRLKQFRHEVDRLRDLIHRLALQAVHEGESEHCYLDLNQVFRDELELYLADPFFKHRVERKFHFTPGLPPIYGHYIDFSQSFRHLVDNALEAMAKSPRKILTVTTAMEDGRRVLRIGDIGGGIPPAVRPHLFEPFFTTRSTEDQPRAGLGLFMARRLLEPYGAEITLESRQGETWATVRWGRTQER